MNTPANVAVEQLRSNDVVFALNKDDKYKKVIEKYGKLQGHHDSVAEATEALQELKSGGGYLLYPVFPGPGKFEVVNYCRIESDEEAVKSKMNLVLYIELIMYSSAELIIDFYFVFISIKKSKEASTFIATGVITRPRPMILLMMNRVYTLLRTVMATSKLEKLVISFSRVTQLDGSRVRTRDQVRFMKPKINPSHVRCICYVITVSLSKLTLFTYLILTSPPAFQRGGSCNPSRWYAQVFL